MPTVQLFITSWWIVLPPNGEATLSILRRVGLTVEFPHNQTCCGQPPFNAGLRRGASIVEHTIRVFEKTDGDIIVPSGSCAHMIKHGYMELFQNDPTCLPCAQPSEIVFMNSRSISSITWASRIWVRTGMGRSPIIHHVTSLRGMHIDRQPMRPVGKRERRDAGRSAGSRFVLWLWWHLFDGTPELSAEWLKRKIGNLKPPNPPTLVVTEAGCLMHLAGGLHRQNKNRR